MNTGSLKQKNCSSAIIKRRNLSKQPNNQAAPNVNLNSIQTDGQLNQACNPKQDNDIVITKRGNYHKNAPSSKRNCALNSVWQAVCRNIRPVINFSIHNKNSTFNNRNSTFNNENSTFNNKNSTFNNKNSTFNNKNATFNKHIQRSTKAFNKNHSTNQTFLSPGHYFQTQEIWRL